MIEVSNSTILMDINVAPTASSTEEDNNMAQRSRPHRFNGYTDGSTKAHRKISLICRKQTHGPALPSFVHWHSANSKNIDIVAGATDVKHHWS